MLSLVFSLRIHCECGWLKKWVEIRVCSSWTFKLISCNLFLSFLSYCVGELLSPYSRSLCVGYLYVGLIFAITNIQARCWTQCFSMYVRHHNVPCFAFLDVLFLREITEDSMKILLTWLVDQETCVSKRCIGGLALLCFLSVMLQHLRKQYICF